MNEERIDLDPLADWRREERVERVVSRVMRSTSRRPAPRSDLLGAILLLGRPALAAAVFVALGSLATTARGAEREAAVITVGSALGVPTSAERAIRGNRVVDPREMLAILGEM
jgi:hypothetical protein